MNSQALWFASRGTGLVCLLLLSGAMVLGALNSGRFASSGWPRFAIATVHRNLSLLAVLFLSIHVTTAIIDTYAGIRWLDIVIPFGSPYRPLWLGLGSVACDLLLALVISSLLRPRINIRFWRALHWTAYLCWPLAVIHGLGTAPADARQTWVLAFDGACVLAVVAALIWRASTRHPDTEARARIGGGT